MDFAAMKPADLRGLIRKGELTGPTTGMCNGYAQGNLVVLPKALAWDFLLFCQRNPVDAIGGATISSRAVVSAINSAIDCYNNDIAGVA